MGPLQPGTTSVSITTFVATTVVLVLWLLAIVALATYLILRRHHHADEIQRTTFFNRSASYGNTAPLFPSSNPIVLPSHPQRAWMPSHPPNDPSPPFATIGATELYPVRTKSPNIGPVPRGASNPISIADFGRTPTVPPPRNSVPSAPPSNEARPHPLSASNTSQAAMLARSQTTPLASDTTDTSADTVDLGRQVVNPGYLAMLAQRGIPARDHALLGSDDSTDAGGGGPGAARSYAIRARGMEMMGVRVDVGRDRGRLADRVGRGRAATFGQESRDYRLERLVEPLSVRKMPSM